MTSPTGDVDAQAVASRLDLWMRSGCNQRRSSATSSESGELLPEPEYAAYAADNSRVSSACSSRSSSSAPQVIRRVKQWDDNTAATPATTVAVDGKRSQERRISLPEDSPPPKPTSDIFRAKRAQHYNEVAALRSWNRHGQEGDSSPESDTSDENAQTKTNTNTNINQTIAKAVDRRKGRQTLNGDSTDNTNNDGVLAATGGAASSSLPSSAAQGPIRAAASSVTAERDRGRVSFSDVESGAESTEEFRDLRRTHYSHEWIQDPSIPTSVSSLETNTNTNLNAGGTPSDERLSKPLKNPMEAGRPPVKFGIAGAEAEPCAEHSSEAFRARRQNHYDEFAALRRFKDEAQAHLGEEVEEDAEDEDDEREAEVARGSAPSSSPGNPMEPREAGVAFQMAGAADEVLPGGISSAAQGNSDAWKSLRNAHYNDMAAALRSMPPPSEDEDGSEDG